MTKQEILSAIAEKIAGQGNQVDIGGALGPVLDAIVELIPDSSPLIVEGTVTYSGYNKFIPSEGQPSWQEAAAHFLSGGKVILKYTTAEPGTLFLSITGERLREDADAIYGVGYGVNGLDVQIVWEP